MRHILLGLLFFGPLGIQSFYRKSLPSTVKLYFSPNSVASNVRASYISWTSRLLLLISSPTFVTLDDKAVADSRIDSDIKPSSATITSTQDAVEFVKQLENRRSLLSDELEIVFTESNLGISISETSYNGFPVCTVSKLPLEPEFSRLNPDLRVGAVITRINGTKVDGIALRDIAKLVKACPRPLSIRFRDPSRFFESLDSTRGTPLAEVTSSYLPANARDAGAPEQIIRVKRLDLPSAENRLRLRPCELNDVLEIQYIAQVEGSDDIVDSSAERAPPGTSSRSVYYVLGQRNGPPGVFPPGWDLTLRGMVVGERRRITLPYTVAFERKGVPSRGIPPFATMIYTVRLLSLT